ncbi:MAG: hypothetical protein E6700_10160 [Winkia neuii]|uniref:Uncharacterized protein n=1 Tax=Winkia neuii TaxID=33007 RepID=A0A2I1ILE0_9ACTO|nr:hypothetical protein [Winkia neuii]OFJ69997.1 hypothetical protein HMPREF2851_11010 [Actinomyces sp. HMSC064C12]OFK04532.1 hypothetical protein HMPREF2835_03680 [Actinomyces sp. HMSC072A03]OFT56154.1 hypothetical protein HMPREF3152_02575 [Actinomyces sp. HMSC06A08]KWZ72016.1 hypothetical protein HMPREF3198_02108 [Winkia neuii]MDK8100693.1 hypothetical protein [Winkia neuii]
MRHSLKTTLLAVSIGVLATTTLTGITSAGNLEDVLITFADNASDRHIPQARAALGNNAPQAAVALKDARLLAQASQKEALTILRADSATKSLTILPISNTIAVKTTKATLDKVKRLSK